MSIPRRRTRCYVGWTFLSAATLRHPRTLGLFFARRGARIRARTVFGNCRPKEIPRMATVTDTAAHDRWERENAKAPPREQPPTTVSSVPVEALYTPDHMPELDHDRDLGYPGQYPF